MVKILKLIWDENNIAHISKHDVTQEEVEQVCKSNPVVQKGKKDRLLVIGLTNLGKMVTVILDPESEKEVYYPVTARSTAKKERRIYRKEKENE